MYVYTHVCVSMFQEIHVLIRTYILSHRYREILRVGYSVATSPTSNISRVSV